jgi:hypothetical protein
MRSERVRDALSFGVERGEVVVVTRSVGQNRTERLKRRLQPVQAQDESLIAGRAWKPGVPVVLNQAMHPFLLEAAL